MNVLDAKHDTAILVDIADHILRETVPVVSVRLHMYSGIQASYKATTSHTCGHIWVPKLSMVVYAVNKGQPLYKGQRG